MSATRAVTWFFLTLVFGFLCFIAGAGWDAGQWEQEIEQLQPPTLTVEEARSLSRKPLRQPRLKFRVVSSFAYVDLYDKCPCFPASTTRRQGSEQAEPMTAHKPAEGVAGESAEARAIEVIEACTVMPHPQWPNGIKRACLYCVIDALRAADAAARAEGAREEREACAKMAEDCRICMVDDPVGLCCVRLAGTIRARAARDEGAEGER